MGLVHTGIRSKLGVEKVRKTTMVGMDIKRSHLEAGLVPSCKLNHANLTSVADINDQELEDGLVDFNQLSKHLVASAASANRDRDIGDDHNDPNDEFPPDIAMPAATTQLKKTCIPLEIFFEYPTDTDLPSEGMNSFWKGGVENLEKEMEAYDILSSNEEASDGTQCEIMATVDVL